MRNLITATITVLLIPSLASLSFAGTDSQQSYPPDNIKEADMVTFLDGRTDAIWDLSKAYHQTTPTRQRICINGLWQWQPASDDAEKVPEGEWGYFKVPGYWPGRGDYMQKNSQTVHFHPKWKDVRLSGVNAA